MAGAPPLAPTAPLWRGRRFATAWGAQTVSELGDRVSELAVPLVTADLARALVVLTVPVAAALGALTFGHLLAVALLLGA
ncbi:hypothetical protein LG324_15135 [Phycicoccus jejuensis]|uniref:hypothetical protein n=1 Tax=Phycicoccus jejuensis TaxID=367299 RepID=UPI00384BBAE1